VTTEQEGHARFLRRVGSVQEMGMRVALWRELLEDNHPDDALSTLLYVMEANHRKSNDGYLAMLAFARLLVTHRSLVEGSILPAAVVSRCDHIVDLVTERAPARKIELAERRIPSLDKDREVTLGERRALARSRDRHIIDRLLRDPDEGVIKNLLQNSRVRERDVLLIASTQPISGAVLEVVFRSDRWGNRREIQLALLQNPYTPTLITRALVELVDEAGLRSVALAQSIEENVLALVQEKLRSLPDEGGGESAQLDDAWVLSLLERRERNPRPAFREDDAPS